MSELAEPLKRVLLAHTLTYILLTSNQATEVAEKTPSQLFFCCTLHLRTRAHVL